MKIGVIGCGAVSHYCHIPALRRIPGVTIAAVADPDETLRNRAAASARCPAFKSAEFLIANSNADGVIIATPPQTHAAIATMAARAGKAIYLEKPVATALPDAVDLLRSVSQSRVKTAVGFNKRRHPLYARARDVIAHGKIGRVRALQTTFCEPVPVGGMPRWKVARSSGGGALLDLASHHIDLARWLTGAEVVSVEARLFSDKSEHDSASLQMSLSDETSVQTFVSFCAGYAERIAAMGDGGTVELDRHRGSLTVQTPRRFGYGARKRMALPALGDWSWKVRHLARPSYDPSYYRALAAFARGSDQLATLDDGIRSLRVAIAAEESATTGAAVTVIYP